MAHGGASSQDISENAHRALLAVAALLRLAQSVWVVDEGYQDERGFHFGAPWAPGRHNPGIGDIRVDSMD